MNVIVPIPVYGRLPLVNLTVKRLYEKNKVHKVICVGHEPELKELCESLGAEWLEHPNSQLGLKWNAGFEACKKYNPDAVLFAGSSDWIATDYLEKMLPLIERYDIVGKLGCHLAHISNRIESVFWPGYIDKRAGEPIGIGRLLSKRFLDQIGWRPFSDMLIHNMDWSMWTKVTKQNSYHVASGEFPMTLSVSTDKWDNKHQFTNHLDGTLPSERIHPGRLMQEFPELTEL